MTDVAASEDQAPDVIPPAGFPVKMLIIIVVAALVAGIGGAFVIVKWMGGKSANVEKADAPVAAEAKRETGVIFDLEPFIVNLADTPEIRYLKLTIKLEVESQGVSTDLAARIPQIRDTILVLLTSKDSATIRTTQGKFQLRDEITQRVNALLQKPGVRSAYFTDMVVQ